MIRSSEAWIGLVTVVIVVGASRSNKVFVAHTKTAFDKPNKIPSTIPKANRCQYFRMYGQPNFMMNSRLCMIVIASNEMIALFLQQSQVRLLQYKFITI